MIREKEIEEASKLYVEKDVFGDYEVESLTHKACMSDFSAGAKWMEERLKEHYKDHFAIIVSDEVAKQWSECDE